ncbi:MAG: GAF domain-containing protein, partial [Waterburya sp.]
MTQSPNLKINNHQHLEEIFKLTIDATKKALECDRVIIYDASELPKSEVIAESIDAKYGSSSTTETSLINPFLSGDYLELYCYGQAVAVDNIYQTNVSASQLKDLERLEIKSILIAPIAVDNQLVAFLAAHHCQEFQTWSSITIKFVTEKAKALGYALSNIVKAQNSESVSDVYSSENGFIPPPPSSSKEVLTVATTAKSQQHESLTMEQEKNDQGNG